MKENEGMFMEVTKEYILNVIASTQNEKTWCVYMHTSPSGKKYVGITSQDPIKRWRNGGSGYLCKNSDGTYRHPALANAILKYPWDEWKHEVLLVGETEEYAKNVEKCLIRHYKTKDRRYGYNLTDGGDGMSGWIPDEKWREKQSALKTGKPLSEETKKKISKANKGHIVSEETRQKISDNHADFSGENHPLYGTHLSEETKQKIRDGNKGKEISVETRKKISESVKGKNSGENHYLYGKHHSEETKNKISLWGQTHKQKNAKTVRCIETGEIFDSMRKAEIVCNVFHVRECCLGIMESTKGLHFEFVDNGGIYNGTENSI